MRLTAALVLALFLTAPAEAGLQVCNKARVPAKVSLGRIEAGAWQSQGWWGIAPGKCATLLGGPLDARYYYLYGTDGGSGTWGGDMGFCTKAAGSFKIAGRGNCAARGYDSTGFFEIDTQDRTDWKQSLSD